MGPDLPEKPHSSTVSSGNKTPEKVVGLIPALMQNGLMVGIKRILYFKSRWWKN